ncbi:FCH domain containing protein [Trichuris trichiura]|uniref:FCH domain containing protein n=1 Tax=Trichuris trichiura TaxID=36087 RepID=A0A077ZK63_TRITR|nr:FCH domain containing protein [Trichuris trichiura]
MDFSEHFWGDKHNGFAVMYQIMKGGQQTVKDLFDLIKERAGVEDENHRHGAKTVKLISNFDNHSSLNPLWCTLKSYFQRLLDVQQGFVIRLLDLSKEVQRRRTKEMTNSKFTSRNSVFDRIVDKCIMAVKEKESKTFEAVKVIQTTTTCLQKAKEMYHTRYLELDKMKRDNCSLKELNKMQIRTEKAREEYRHYVDKYENVRVDFEERLTAAAKNFQSLQLNHFEQMKKFLTTYMCSVSSYYQSLLSLSQETNAEIHSVDVTALLAELVATRGTGAERPVRVKFEEPQCAGTHHLFPSSSSETPICETIASTDSPINLDGIPFDIDQSNSGRRGANTFLPSGSRERGSCTSSFSSTNSSPMTSTG